MGIATNVPPSFQIRTLPGNYRFIAGIDYCKRLDALSKDIRNGRTMLKSQVEHVRQEIQEHGESVVGCEELRLLCPDEVLVGNQWAEIAKIAMSEGWSFTYFPNGSVAFANL